MFPLEAVSFKAPGNMKKYEEKLVAKLNPGMGNKYERKKTLEVIRNDKRVTLAGETGEKKKKRGLAPF